MEFGFMLGFWAFLSLAILVIIYLIRPKPKDLTIPSLMFIMKQSGRAVKSSFLEKLLRNLIFFLQFLALGCLALAITQPTINLAYDSAAANTVIILDASASMAANDNARFDEAVSIAKDSMKGDVSIVLAEEFPVLLLNNGNRAKARSLLSSIGPKDVGTNLGDAMLLSKDLLEGEEGRVLVLSDFAYTTGPDPNVVKKILEADGATVDFVNVGSKGDNAGIIDLLVTKYNTDVYIKNYNNEGKEITASVINNGEEIKKVSMSISANSMNSFSFETPSGQTEIMINEEDDLMADNTAYISAPEKVKIKVLLISNSVNTYLRKAMEASKDIELSIAEPPIIPDFKDFDVVILGNIEKDKILTGTLEDLMEWTEKGKSIIITANTDTNGIDFKGLIPVSLKERMDLVGTNIYAYSETSDYKYDFTEEDDLEFGSTNQYFDAEAENNSVVYAMTAENTPIIVSAKRGDGNVVFYGIIDRMATFKASTSYPVFWNELINSLVGTEDIANFNYPTGKIILLGEDTRVTTPSEKLRTDRLLLDGAGFYTFNEKTIAANLLNKIESDINRDTEFSTTEFKEYTAEKVERRKDVNLENYLIFAALIAILLELFIVKYRGDI